MKLVQTIRLFFLVTQAAFLTTTEKSIAQTNNGHSDFPVLVMTTIAGAPRLSNPILITGDTEPSMVDISLPPGFRKVQGEPGPLVGQGFGLAAPAYWDWDGDGLKDLLIGEFGSGAEFGRYSGNFIRVYPNTGTESQPAFSGGFDFAKPPFEILSNGTPYSVDQFCCIGFTPQFVDLNSDGYTDMVSGQYYGEVIVFNGSEKGFLPGQPVAQEGNPRGKRTRASQEYWLYSSASFGDFTGDGKKDLIVGGSSLRMSKNVGTLSEPKFALREPLLDPSGQPLKIYRYTPEEVAAFKGGKPYTAGDAKVSPLVVDWDSDGVSDLLVTNSYHHKNLPAVSFFRGILVGNDIRFEPGIPLFTSKGGKKAFPGIALFLFVTDWNHDGINDLLIGTSVVTLHGKFNSYFSWNWEEDTGLFGTGKDPGFLIDRNPATDVSWILNEVKLPMGIGKEEFATMRHQGYVYLMLGEKNDTDIKKSSNESR